MMAPQVRIRVFSIDDHALLREGLAAIINNEPDMRLVAHATTGSDAITQYAIHKPDVTLMDLRLPDMSGIDTLIAIRLADASARVVILTTFESDVETLRAFKAGACGYLLKSAPPAELVDAIRLVHTGGKQVPADVAAQLAACMNDDDRAARRP